jgi:hypothetical protein
MLHAPRLELLVGAYRDAWLGPVLTVGAGGIWVEAFADVAHRVLPLGDEGFDAMLDDLRIARTLTASRGRRAVDRMPIVAALRAVARAVILHPEIEEVEVNPLFVYEEGAEPVDARVVLTES